MVEEKHRQICIVKYLIAYIYWLVYIVTMVSTVTNYFSSQIDEIENVSALRIYGIFLSFTYLLTAIYWHLNNFAKIFSVETDAICWPQFANCQNFRFLTANSLTTSFFIFAVGALLCAFLFFKKKVKAAYVLLIILELIKIGYISLDFQARMNQHYMLFFAFLFFVFVPQKQLFSRYIILGFYFFAGLLKFKPEWISGDAIYGHLLLIPDQYKSIAAIYVIVLELCVVWGLISKNKTIFWLSYIQFLIFHLASFTVVGFFYPLLMYCLLTIFPLMLYEKSETKSKANKSKLGLVLFAFFCFLNIWPKTVSGDTSITGEGRLVALHMFDSKIYCDSIATIKLTGLPSVTKDLRIPTAMRIRCDPIIFLSQLRQLCRELKSNPKFQDIDWLLQSSTRDTGQKATVVHISEFCKEDPQYSIWGNNPWIQK